MAAKNEMTVNTNDGEMKVCVMNITPKKANEFLCLNQNNRNLRRTRVDMYSRDMSQGNWKSNGVPIVIGNDGELKDGQHRLQACVKSGVTLKNTLVVYLPQKQANCFDIGAARTVRDIAVLSGLYNNPCYLSSNVFSAAHAAIYGIASHRTFSKLALLTEMQKHEDACEFITYRVINKCRNASAKLVRASISGAVFNAFLNGYNLEKLEHFCDVYASGVAKNDEDAVIIKLRDATITLKDNSKEGRQDLYMKAQLALHCYETGENVATLGKNKTEYYAYPDKQIESDDGQLTL